MLNLTSNATCEKNIHFKYPDGILARTLPIYTAVVTVICFVTLCALGLTIRLLAPKGAIHPSYRIIFLSLSIASSIDCLICFLMSIYHLVGTPTQDNNVGPAIPAWLCGTKNFLRSWARTFGLVVLVFSGIERVLLAEKKMFAFPSNMTKGGYIIVVTSGVIASGGIMSIIQKFSSEMCYCGSNIFGYPAYIYVRILVVIAVTLFSSLSLAFQTRAWYVNRRFYADFSLETQDHSLGERFALSSNMKLGRLLQASAILRLVGEFLFSAVDIIGYAFSEASGASNEVWLCYIITVYLVNTLYSLTQCAVYILCHGTINRRFHHLLNIDRPTIQPSPDPVAESSLVDRNQIIVEMWDTYYPL